MTCKNYLFSTKHNAVKQIYKKDCSRSETKGELVSSKYEALDGFSVSDDSQSDHSSAGAVSLHGQAHRCNRDTLYCGECCPGPWGKNHLEAPIPGSRGVRKMEQNLTPKRDLVHSKGKISLANWKCETCQLARKVCEHQNNIKTNSNYTIFLIE